MTCKLIDEIVMEEWNLDLKDPPPCYLYDFKNMGITKSQFVDIIKGNPAYVFEKPFEDFLRGYTCPWCDYNSRKLPGLGKKAQRWRGKRLDDHVYAHNKNIVSYQIQKFQQELYSIRLQLVKKGFHASIPFLVEHTCQICISPVVKGRKGKCSIPTSPRNRIRSLKVLNYPIDEIKKNRRYEWSALGVIVLKKV